MTKERKKNGIVNQRETHSEQMSQKETEKLTERGIHTRAATTYLIFDMFFCSEQ